MELQKIQGVFFKFKVNCEFLEIFLEINKKKIDQLLINSFDIIIIRFSKRIYIDLD